MPASLLTRIVSGAIVVAAACLLWASVMRGQGKLPIPASARRGVLMSDQVHTNLKLLKGIPEDQFLDTMGFFSAALGVPCEFCHSVDSIGN